MTIAECVWTHIVSGGQLEALGHVLDGRRIGPKGRLVERGQPLGDASPPALLVMDRLNYPFLPMGYIFVVCYQFTFC